MQNHFKINFFGSSIPFNTDNLPERSYLTGSGTNRPIGLTLQEISQLYWNVKSFKVAIGVIDYNSGFDLLGTFLSAGGGTGGIIGALGGLAAVNQQLAKPIAANLNGRTKLFSAYQRKNRKCSPDGGNFSYDKMGNIIDTKDCQKLKVDKSFVAFDDDTDEAKLCVSGPIHSLISPNGQGYIQINMTDVIYSKGLYWPIILIIIGNGEVILTSDIISPLGSNQNAYNIGGINFCNMGVITMSGYSLHQLQPIFYSIQGQVNIGERCCDSFYYDGVNRNEDSNNPCGVDCYGEIAYTNLPDSINANFVDGNISTDPGTNFVGAARAGTSENW